MLEQLKSQVLIAYHELNRCGLDEYAKGSVSAIDRESGLIVMISAKAAFVVDMHGNFLEGSHASAWDVQSHIALYQAFPKLGGIVRLHARYAAMFAQIGLDIPVLGALHQNLFREKIPCAASASDLGNTFRVRSMDPLLTPAALVVRHSAYAWGKTVIDAVNNAAALEETACLAYQTMQHDPRIQPLQ